MKKLFIYIIIFISLSVKAQLNLVPNGDFEIYSSLPNDVGEVFKAVSWNNINNNYSAAYPYGSPDYFYNPINGALTWSGPINPISGNGQMGMILYDFYDQPSITNYREYISSKLLISMIKGHLYKISFYLSNGNGINNLAACNNFGIHFSENPLIQMTSEPIPVIPQIEITNVVYFLNYWQKFSFNYKADSMYNFISIGNFKDDFHTSTTKYSINPYNAYYFIDKIEIIPLLNITGDTILCKGDTATLTATMDTVKWATALQPNLIISTDKTIKVNPMFTTTYLAYDAYDTASFTVYMVNKPMVNLGNDTILCFGHSIILDASLNAVVYQWQDNTANETYTVNHEGQYWVKLTDTNQCTASDTIIVNFQYCPMPEIWIPNSFTPNGDGLNDIFKPETLAELENYTMLIFNRWGELIYESHDINKGWDGKFKGKLVEFGVYTYRIEATDKATKEKKVYNGRVTLVN